MGGGGGGHTTLSGCGMGEQWRGMGGGGHSVSRCGMREEWGEHTLLCRGVGRERNGGGGALLCEVSVFFTHVSMFLPHWSCLSTPPLALGHSL